MSAQANTAADGAGARVVERGRLEDEPGGTPRCERALGASSVRAARTQAERCIVSRRDEERAPETTPAPALSEIDARKCSRIPNPDLVDQAFLEGEAHRLGAAPRSQLGDDAAHVG